MYIMTKNKFSLVQFKDFVVKLLLELEHKIKRRFYGMNTN